jgi:hypothetical protein
MEPSDFKDQLVLLDQLELLDQRDQVSLDHRDQSAQLVIRDHAGPLDGLVQQDRLDQLDHFPTCPDQPVSLARLDIPDHVAQPAIQDQRDGPDQRVIRGQLDQRVILDQRALVPQGPREPLGRFQHNLDRQDQLDGQDQLDLLDQLLMSLDQRDGQDIRDQPDQPVQ